MLSMCPSGPRSLSLVIAVADKDEQFVRELQKHLRPLSDSGQLACWILLDIPPGKERTQEIEKQCQHADLFLMLLSSDFLVSRDCRQITMLAQKRKAEELALVLSVRLRRVRLKRTAFHESELLLDYVLNEHDHDQAWKEITGQICALSRDPLRLLQKLPEYPRNPYKGPLAFHQEDADNFFGRDVLIGKLLTTLEDMLEDDKARLLAIIGPSGVGKSSVVRAGLLPLLQTGIWADSKHWVINPSDNPLNALVTPLAIHLREVEIGKISHDLQAGEENILHEYAQHIAEKLHVSRVVLVIDQLEELFLLSVSADDRRRFLALVSAAVRTPHGPLLVVLTLRDDFLPRFMDFPDFFSLMDAHLSRVPPMTQSEIVEAIEKPAFNAHIRFDEHLVSDMLLEVQGQAGALPMLQFVLEQLFNAREGILLTRTAYEKIGGVKGAIRKQAEKTYDRLPDEQYRRWVRSIFLRLVAIGTSDPDLFSEEPSASGLVQGDRDNRGIRAAIRSAVRGARRLQHFRTRIPGRGSGRVKTPSVNETWYEQNVMRKRESQTDLLSMADPAEQLTVQKCIDAFVNARLLTTLKVEEVTPTTSEVTHVSTIEVSHEVVLREWQRLKDWISERPGDLHLQQNLAHAIEEWERHQKASDWLYRGQQLRDAKKWARRNRPMEQERAFLRASRKQERASLLRTVLPVLLVLAIIGGVQWRQTTQPFVPDPNHVTNMQDDGEGSLRWCLVNAHSGSTVIIDPTLKGTITLKNALTIDKPLTVIGPGENALALTIQQSGLIIDARDTVSIANLSFTRGSPSSVSIDSTTMYIAVFSTVHLNHVTIAHNQQVGIYNAGTLTLANVTISNNSPSGLSGPGPGAVYNTITGKMTITNSTITGNTSSANNSSGVGGVFNDGKMTITNSTITGNASSPRNSVGTGGVYNDGTIAITNSTISNNAAFSDANGVGIGGVQNSSGNMTISNSTISGNSSSGAGYPNIGGVASGDGNVTISNSTISDNSSSGIGRYNIGGVYSGDETMMITNSTISDNSASYTGGVVNDIGTMTIANSTISHNSSSNIAGIKTGAGGSTMLFFCTITENTGQGMLVNSTTKDKPSSMTVQNTILLATSIAINAPYSVFQSNGYNLADDANASFFGKTGDHIMQDPSTLFEHGDLLAQNGGATQTIQIRVGSAAYAAIPMQTCHTQAIYDAQNFIYIDQRDQLRPGKGKAQCDIGAYETQQ